MNKQADPFADIRPETEVRAECKDEWIASQIEHHLDASVKALSKSEIARSHGLVTSTVLSWAQRDDWDIELERRLDQVKAADQGALVRRTVNIAAQAETTLAEVSGIKTRAITKLHDLLGFFDKMEKVGDVILEDYAAHPETVLMMKDKDRIEFLRVLAAYSSQFLRVIGELIPLTEEETVEERFVTDEVQQALFVFMTQHGVDVYSALEAAGVDPDSDTERYHKILEEYADEDPNQFVNVEVDAEDDD